MKRYRGKKRLATMEKQAWQKKFLKAQDALLSDYAYNSYKELGRGMVFIDLNKCLDFIIPGMNIPELDYYCELTLNPDHPHYKNWLERIKSYDPEKKYLIGFKTYQADRPFIRSWVRNLKLLSEEEYKEEYALADVIEEVTSADELPDRVQKGNVVFERLKFDDPTKH